MTPGTRETAGWGAGMFWLATSIVVQVLAMDPLVGAYDEGLVLYAASQVRQGAWPYRDFWSLYAPGSFYLLATLFQVFGESVWVGRAMDVASRTAIVLMVFQLTSGLGSRGAAWAASGVVLVVLTVVQEYEFPVFPACATALLAVSLLEASISARSAWRGFAAGAALGATALIRQDLGAGAGVACLALYLLTVRQAGRGEAQAIRRCMLRPALAGLSLVVLPCIVALLAHVPLRDLHENLVRIPLQVYADTRWLPFPSISAAVDAVLSWKAGGTLFPVIVYAPVVIVVGVVLLRWREIAAGLTAAPATGSTGPLLAGLLILAVFFFLKGVVRVSPAHMAPALVVSTIVLAASVAGVTSRARRAALVAVAVLAVGVPLASPFLSTAKNAASMVAALATGSRTLRGDDPWSLCRAPTVPRLRCFRTAPDRAAVARFLIDHTAPGRTIYVGAGRHDKLLLNDVVLYFLSGHAAATRWHDLHPGVQTTAEIQREMISELDRRDPAWVVLNSQWDDAAEPNDSALSSGVHLLDEHLARRYAPVARQGTFTLLAPRRAEP